MPELPEPTRAVPSVGRTVEKTDIDGDGTVDMTTTTTVDAEPIDFVYEDGSRAQGIRTVEIEVSEVDADGDGIPDAKSITVTEWIEADLNDDGDLDLVSVSERSGLDHDGDGTADFVTEHVSEDVAVDTNADGTRDTVIHTHSEIARDTADEGANPSARPALRIVKGEGRGST